MWDVFGIKKRLRTLVSIAVADEIDRRRLAARDDTLSPDLAPRALRRSIDQLNDSLNQFNSGIDQIINSIAGLTTRLDRLERLSTEHPAVFTRDIAAPSFATPAVSVIMPTWNRARIIGAAIRSVQAQSFADWELLVIDDGSEDDTADVVASFNADPRIRYVRLPHAGQCPARNHGQSIAKGSVIAYLDSDNLWYPDFLLVAVNLFRYRQDIKCAYGAMVSDTHNPRILFEPFDRERLLIGNFIDTSAFVHRRDLIARHGGFDQATSPMEDWDLILRYTVDAPAFPLPVLAVRYREVDAIRMSDTQDKVKPKVTIQQKWTSSDVEPGSESRPRHVDRERL